MSTFNVSFIRSGHPSHPVEKYRQDTEDQTDITVESLHGCFNSTIRIIAFSGEVQIFIHTTTGHYFNWCVVMTKPDTAPIIIQCPEYKSGTIDDAFDAITKHDEAGPWWDAALPKIKEWMYQSKA